MTKPTIVFVPGVWHLPECFDSTRELLSEKGFTSEAIAHPSVGAKLPDKTLADDVSSLRTRLVALADEGKEIVLIAHSYGGLVGGCAVEDLGFTDRAKAGKKGGVTILVYMCALVGTKGASMLEMLGGKMLPWLDIGEDNFVRPTNPENYLYHDVSSAEQAKWVSKLQPTSALIYQGPCTHEPWSHMPCMFLYCSEDRAFVPEAQNTMIENIRRTGDITVFPCVASHSPFLSMPKKVVECLELAARLGTEKSGRLMA